MGEAIDEHKLWEEGCLRRVTPMPNHRIPIPIGTHRDEVPVVYKEK